MWNVSNPRAPRLVTTTGAAGQGTDPKFPGWNDFILHNSQRPNAKAFRNGAAPSLANGNILLVTEEDYEQPDCSQAGSFQTWWVKRLDGTGQRDRAAGQGGALRPRQLPAPGRRVLLLALVRLPPVGHRHRRVLRRRHPAASTYATPRTSSPTATPRGASRRSGTPTGCRCTRRPASRPAQEDQPRLLRRPGPRHRRLPRRPAGRLWDTSAASIAPGGGGWGPMGSVAGVLGGPRRGPAPAPSYGGTRRRRGRLTHPDRDPERAPDNPIAAVRGLCEHRALCTERRRVRGAGPARHPVPVAARLELDEQHRRRPPGRGRAAARRLGDA